MLPRPTSSIHVRLTKGISNRIRAIPAKKAGAPQSSNIFISSFSALTAVVREASYLQLTPARKSFWIQIPPFGSIMLILSYLALILALEFKNNDIPGAQHYEALGIRAAWLAVAQVPLIILLAGKNNLIGLFTGTSYERLNVFHRWVARGLLLLVTFHFGFQAYGWSRYGLVQLEWETDTCFPTGVAAYVILIWMNLSTIAPLRHMSYEFFVVQHILTFFGFIIAIMMHLPDTAYYSRVYIYIPIVLYFLDRLVRTARYVFNNIRPGQAKLEALDGGATRIRVASKQIKKWTPGAHVLLSIPKLGFGQSHPATILSTPSSHNGELVFILKAHKGFTRRCHQACHASSSPSYTALIDGPYTARHSDFAAFDTLILIAGGTGITFTISTLLDLAQRAASQPLPLRTIDFVWVIKQRSVMSWISEELELAFQSLQRAGITIKMKICITCDDNFVEPSGPSDSKSGCQCEPGNCCCCGPSEHTSDPKDISQPAITDEKEATQKTAAITSIAPSISSRSSDSSAYTSLHKGRPSLDLDTYFWPLLDDAEGETAVAVCGPLGLSTQVRSAVVKVSDERAVSKGSGAYGIYLWVEQFCL